MLERSVTASLGVALSAALAAQMPTSGRSTLSDDALARFVVLQPHERGWLAAGRDYKAYCNADGVEFVPALGDAAPHNVPLRLRLRDIRRGDAVLHEATPVEPTRGEGRVCYRRGTTDELYDVRSDGLKQSFVFHRRPAGSGELVVRLDLETELQPTQHADGHLDLLAPGLGGVRIGRVLVFDAVGKQGMGRLRMQGRVLDLVVDGTFVDGATLPLTLDPLIGTTPWLTTGGRTAYECDVAAGDWPSGTAYLVVYSARFSATDHDVYALRHVPGSGSSGALALATDPNVLAQRPRVGYVAATDRFLVAWQDSTATRPLRDVRCATVDASTMTASTVVTIAGSAADEFHVAVAGDVGTSDDDAIVAWETDSGIDMRQVSVPRAGNPVPQAVTRLAAGVGTNTPALSKAAERDQSLIAVWQAPGPLGLDIFAQLLTRNLVRIGPVLSLGGGSIIDDREPAVDGSLIAWSRESSSFPNATFDLYCAFVERSAAGLTLRAGPRALATSSAADELGADVARIGWRHCVAYHVLASDGSSMAFAWMVNDDCTTCNARMPLNVVPFGPIQDSGLQPRIGSATSIGNGDGGFIACSNNSTSFVQSTLRAQVVQNLGPGRPPIDAGGACGTPITFLADASAFAVGNSRFAFASSAPNQTLLVLAVGLANSWVSCGPCRVTNPFVVVPSATLGVGLAGFPVPCDPGYIGLALEVQWQGIDPTANGPCPLVPQLSVSTRRTYVISD